MSKIATGGPPPKPTHLKLIDGNPGKRPLNENEPKPAPAAASASHPPYWLSARAKNFWRKYGPILKRIGLLTEADIPAFILLAEAFAD